MRLLTLASSSPRRRDLLARAGIAFRILAIDVDESLPEGISPEEAARMLARRKALAARDRCPEGPLLAADTLVALEGRILGKPHDEDEARAMLRSLSGRWHDVYTGICLLSGGACRLEAVHARVRMAAWDEDEIESYVRTGEPMDKAGAYAIQGRAGAYIERIEGDPYTVEGLPICRVREWLKNVAAV